ncbi:MAG: hypothetical protein V5A40_18365, partial [Haloarculaceae archaeon]
MLSPWLPASLFVGLFALPGPFVPAYGLREGLVGYRLDATDPTPIAMMERIAEERETIYPRL